MLFYVYLISLIATIGVIQAQTLPSATTCAKGSPISIKRNDCKEGTVTERFHLTYSSGHLANLLLSAASFSGARMLPFLWHLQGNVSKFCGDALTALNSGMDKCTGAPANVTIGITQPISVLLDNGVGNQQC
ncbi:hypothetical protein PSHT_12292 [Puccinia striiformis]|uniref:Secreted protein n=1 Tax=Puccinia striiformis TaxID=27350 RepID=A0A2S4UXR1_9BASI|nr:hypothetical protein PSHT_12292 [Puccinia striiformis]